MPRKPNPPEGYYTAQEAMDALHMSSSTFYYFVKQGRILKYTPPGFKIGYFKKSYIDALVQALSSESADDRNDYQQSLRDFPRSRGMRNSE